MKTFAEFQEAAFAIPAAAGVISKVLPAAAATVGAIGTYMQARRVRKNKDKTTSVAKDLGLDLTDPRQRRKAQSRAVARGLKKKGKTNKKINPKTDELVRSRYGKISNTDKIMPKSGEAQKAKELVDKYNKRGRPKKGSSPYKKNIRPDILDSINKKISKSKNQFEDVIPTNSTGTSVPGTGDDSSTVVVKKKKPPMLKRKTYAKGGIKSRKPWLDYLKNK